MKKWIIILFAVALMAFLLVNGIQKQSRKVDDERKWYVEQLHYDFSGEIDSIQLLNAKIGRYIMASTTLLEVNPDSIIVQYMKLSQTTLPIELVSSIELAPQYMLTDKIHLDPARIIVFGPKKVLSKLKSIQTECLEVKNLNDTNSFRCKLKQIKSVRYSTKEINVKLFVEQFTEKKVQIPITAVNCPDNLYIRSFPAFVIATYTVGLSYFNSLIPNDIQVLLDYNDIKSGDLSKQKLKIINNSSHISNIRISPQEVEFIMEEK